jgi:hypothetical protein
MQFRNEWLSDGCIEVMEPPRHMLRVGRRNVALAVVSDQVGDRFNMVLLTGH